MSAINCFIPANKLKAFEEHLHRKGFVTRPHTNPFTGGIQVQVGKEWYAVVWNKAWKRYTVDKRLQDLVDSF